jgi:hypothetical protein
MPYRPNNSLRSFSRPPPSHVPLRVRRGGGHKRRHRMRGGYSSASTYGDYVNGNENVQFDRVFSQSGPYASVPGNMSIGAQGQNANMAGMPNANSLALIQNAGSRHSRKRRGGFLGEVINQALVPASLLTMQQTYKRNKSQKAGKKGGFVGEVINQALVPATLLTMQQRYGRKKSQNTGKRGGFVGEVINQALVPASLLTLQQTYRRKSSSNSKSRRRYK